MHEISSPSEARILVVDDDADVRDLTVAVLEAADHNVIAAEDGAAAFLLLEEHPSVSLLLTDVVMPRMDGLTLADLAKTRRPDLKVIYITGFADAAFVRERAGTLHGPLFSKPYRAAQLQQAVDVALG
jgi:two-component system cell cycle response regulator CpdR